MEHTSPVKSFFNASLSIAREMPFSVSAQSDRLRFDSSSLLLGI